ncbi:MAG: metallophosphoesterase [Clostridia bacterium]|nr:metallophosphoesterase [Clostridia bacterium]
MRLVKTRIDVGAGKPFRALHLSDNHLCYADMRDGQRKVDLAGRRHAAFSRDGATPEALLNEHLTYARENGLPVLYTGDLIDFVSYQNLERAKAALDGLDYFMAVGNHEFSLYVGEAFEDVPYKMRSYDLVQSFFGNDLLFDSREMFGVNFVAVDDGYYRFDARQLERLKAEAAKGLPIVLMLHNPLHTDALYDMMMKVHPCAYLTGTPAAMMAGYDDYRRRQQLPDEDTLAFIDYVYSQPLIRAVLAGHLHAEWEGPLPSGVTQYVADSGYHGYAREIEFI